MNIETGILPNCSLGEILYVAFAVPHEEVDGFCAELSNKAFIKGMDRGKGEI